MIITKGEFLAKANWFRDQALSDKNGNMVAYWKDAPDRWPYYERIADVVRPRINPQTTSLELGTMGIPIFPNGHQMDYDKHLSYYGERQPEIVHDARCIPWPLESNRYDWFIACRVYHHLWPVQRECFEEARRVARNVVLVVPEILPSGGGTIILPEQFRAWLSDVRPSLIEPVGRFGFMYAWLE